MESLRPVQARLHFLWEAAHAQALVCPALGRYYLDRFQRLVEAEQGRLQLSERQQRSFCPRCSSLFDLLPGVQCRVRLGWAEVAGATSSRAPGAPEGSKGSRHPVVEVTCTTCGWVSRHVRPPPARVASIPAGGAQRPAAAAAAATRPRNARGAPKAPASAAVHAGAVHSTRPVAAATAAAAAGRADPAPPKRRKGAQQQQQQQRKSASALQALVKAKAKGPGDASAGVSLSDFLLDL